MKKVIAGLEESITKGTIPNRGDLLCLNASLAPGVCPQGMSHLWNYTVSTVGSVWSPLHHLFLREEVISIHSGVMPLLVRDSSAHTDMTHLYTQVFFFWLVAAWVKSRAERPSVSGVNRQLHVQIGCKLGIRNRKDELTKQAKRNKLQIKKPEGN